jgi:ERCC4-type nuclease
MEHFRVNPFTIVIDSNETAPFPFKDFTEKGTRKGEPDKVPLLIETVRKPLWNHKRRDVLIDVKKRVSERKNKSIAIEQESFLVGMADYSIQGYEDEFQIERKSIPDLFGTLSGRREKFEAEVKRLHEDCEFSTIMVEGDLGAILKYGETGLNAASVIGTIAAWKIRYPRVHWDLMQSRAAAERWAFRLMKKFYDEKQK